MASASTPASAHCAASSASVAMGPAMVRVSMTRMSTSGNSAAAVRAARTEPLNSAEGWMQMKVSPGSARALIRSTKSLGGGAAVVGNTLETRSRRMKVS